MSVHHLVEILVILGKNGGEGDSRNGNRVTVIEIHFIILSCDF